MSGFSSRHKHKSCSSADGKSTSSTNPRARRQQIEIPESVLLEDFEKNVTVSRSPPRMPTITKSAANIEEDLLSALQCPVCFEYMVPPITLCQNGHSICQECRPKFHTCPTCRRSLMSIRNIALEGLARTLLYPCRYADDGCSEKYNLQTINAHLLVCPYRIYDCLLGEGDKCCWKGKLKELKFHMKTIHSKRVSVFEDVTASCVVWEISYPGCFRDYTHFIFAFGEIFTYRKRFNVDEKKLYFTVEHKGLKSVADKFRYKYKMVKNDEQQKVSWCSVVHSEKDDMEAVVLSGHCIHVDFNTLVAYSKGRRIFSITRTKSEKQ